MDVISLCNEIFYGHHHTFRFWHFLDLYYLSSFFLFLIIYFSEKFLVITYLVWYKRENPQLEIRSFLAKPCPFLWIDVNILKTNKSSVLVARVCCAFFKFFCKSSFSEQYHVGLKIVICCFIYSQRKMAENGRDWFSQASRQTNEQIFLSVLILVAQLLQWQCRLWQPF